MKAILSFLFILMFVSLAGCQSPRTIKELTPAEKVALQKVENDYQAGQMNQADYDLQKAALVGSPSGKS